MHSYDLVFTGHMCYDEILPFQGSASVAPGSAVLCGAMAAARTGRKIAAVTRLAPADTHICDPMKNAGIDVYTIPSEQTTYMKVIHPTEDVDVREMFQKKNSGFFTMDEMPDIEWSHIHLAGITDREFSLEFIEALHNHPGTLSADMQSFVRQVDLDTREIRFRDVAGKEQIVAMMDKVKLDAFEGKLLTGYDDVEKAACQFEDWGCPETVITRSDGVLVRANKTTWFEKFSNKSIAGRTGRGDTTFAAYLSRRIEYPIEESIKFAAALVSLKMESPGPFNGTLDDVLQRMQRAHA